MPQAPLPAPANRITPYEFKPTVQQFAPLYDAAAHQKIPDYLSAAQKGIQLAQMIGQLPRQVHENIAQSTMADIAQQQGKLLQDNIKQIRANKQLSPEQQTAQIQQAMMQSGFGYGAGGGTLDPVASMMRRYQLSMEQQRLAMEQGRYGMETQQFPLRQQEAQQTIQQQQQALKGGAQATGAGTTGTTGTTGTGTTGTGQTGTGQTGTGQTGTGTTGTTDKGSWKVVQPPDSARGNLKVKPPPQKTTAMQGGANLGQGQDQTQLVSADTTNPPAATFLQNTQQVPQNGNQFPKPANFIV